MPGPQGGAGWGTEVLGSSPGPCGQSPGPRTRVWDAARAAAAGQAVSTGSREWAARPLVGVRAACGCPVASQHRAPFPSRPRRSLAGTGHARGPELHPRPWLPRQGGGGRGLRDHPASNRKTRPSPGARRGGAGSSPPGPGGRWAWRPKPAEEVGEEGGGGLCPRGGGFLREVAPLAAAPVGRREGLGLSERVPPEGGAVSISWTQQPGRSRHGPFPLHEEVPLPTSPGAGGQIHPACWGWN